MIKQISKTKYEIWEKNDIGVETKVFEADVHFGKKGIDRGISCYEEYFDADYEHDYSNQLGNYLFDDWKK